MTFRAVIDTRYPLVMNRWIIRDPETDRIVWSMAGREAVYWGAREANRLSIKFQPKEK